MASNLLCCLIYRAPTNKPMWHQSGQATQSSSPATCIYLTDRLPMPILLFLCPDRRPAWETWGALAFWRKPYTCLSRHTGGWGLQGGNRRYSTVAARRSGVLGHTAYVFGCFWIICIMRRGRRRRRNSSAAARGCWEEDDGMCHVKNYGKGWASRGSTI